jgi:hypothetical protein
MLQKSLNIYVRGSESREPTKETTYIYFWKFTILFIFGVKVDFQKKIKIIH